jgi:hypothetical protein
LCASKGANSRKDCPRLVADAILFPAEKTRLADEESLQFAYALLILP